MKADLEYFVGRGALEAELVVTMACGKIRLVDRVPSVVERMRERMQGPFCPKEEDLLEEVTSPTSRWEVLD